MKKHETKILKMFRVERYLINALDKAAKKLKCTKTSIVEKSLRSTLKRYMK